MDVERRVELRALDVAGDRPRDSTRGVGVVDAEPPPPQAKRRHREDAMTAMRRYRHARV